MGKRWMKIVLTILVIAAILWGPALILRANPKILEWMLRPTQIKELSDTDQLRITNCIRPDSLKYVDGYRNGFQDPSWYYIFELDATDKAPGESDDAFVRRMIALDVDIYSRTHENDFELGADYFEYIDPKLLYSFDFEIKVTQVDYDYCHYAYIHYRVIDENTIQIALQCGFM